MTRAFRPSNGESKKSAGPNHPGQEFLFEVNLSVVFFSLLSSFGAGGMGSFPATGTRGCGR